MPRIDEHDSFDVVRGDVLNGLGQSFGPEDDEAFSVTEGFADEDFIGSDRLVAVPWTYRCRHDGDFQGLFPTGRPLRIEGVTFVDNRGDETLLRRYVDWAGVIAQLGLDVSWRIPMTEEEYRRSD